MLTVFIATRNGSATLPEVLSAYTRLLVPRGGWKLVVIDNGSDDRSADIVCSFFDRLPLVLLSEPRRGKNRALNTGLGALEGDLAVFSDDDTIPDADWLVRLREAADGHPGFGVFGGPIAPLWHREPDDWILEWVKLPPAFGMTDPSWSDGPCEPNQVWGANMAIRADLFARGHRFDEHVGPNGSATYAMGGETELTWRLSMLERIACRHCPEARVRHIVTPRMMTKAWILKRAFHLGRCIHRESRQRASVGQAHHLDRRASVIGAKLRSEIGHFASGVCTRDARKVFEARWQINFWLGCLFETAAAGRDARQGAMSVDAPLFP